MDIDIKCCEEDRKLVTEEESVTIDKCTSVFDLKEKYGITEDKLILRLLVVKGAIKNHNSKVLNYDELIEFLNDSMAYTDMKVWLMQMQMEGINLSLSDRIRRLFELKTNEEMVQLYDKVQEHNQKDNKVKTIGTR